MERCIASLKDKVSSEAPKKAPLILQALTKAGAKAPVEEGKKGKHQMRFTSLTTQIHR